MLVGVVLLTFTPLWPLLYMYVILLYLYSHQNDGTLGSFDLVSLRTFAFSSTVQPDD